MTNKGQKLLPLMDGDKRVANFVYDERSHIIYILQSVAGRKIKVSTGVKIPHILKAKRVGYAKLKEKLGRKKTHITPLIKDELDSWIKVKEAEGVKESTLKTIYQAKIRILGFWGSMFPNEITRDNLTNWYAWLDQEYPGQQKEKSIKWMRNFARYLAEKQYNGYPLLSIVPKISDPNYRETMAARKKKKERIFTAQEFKQIYGAASGHTEQLVALLMYTMATRIDETLNLSFVHEIKLDEEVPVYRWRIGQNKADHSGKHALHKSLLPHLKARRLLCQQAGTQLLFPQKNNKQKPLKPQQINWQGWRDRAKLGWHWTSHTFRHTCLSNLFNDEKNPQALICKLYRVSLAVAMETYIKPTSAGILKMRDAIEINI